jgi:hypothetical protein
MLKVADKFVARVEQFYQELVSPASSDAAPLEEDENEEEDDVEIVVELGEEDEVEDDENHTVDDEDVMAAEQEQVQDQEEEELQDDTMADADVDVDVDADADVLIDPTLNDIQALVDQADNADNEIQAEALERASEVEVEMNVQEIVEVEQEVDGANISYRQEIDTKFVVSEEDRHEPQSLLADDDDSLIHNPMAPSAASIFG